MDLLYDKVTTESVKEIMKRHNRQPVKTDHATNEAFSRPAEKIEIGH